MTPSPSEVHENDLTRTLYWDWRSNGPTHAPSFLLPCQLLMSRVFGQPSSHSQQFFQRQFLDLSLRCKVGGILRDFWGWNRATAISGTCQVSMLLAPVRRSLVWPELALGYLHFFGGGPQKDLRSAVDTSPGRATMFVRRFFFFFFEICCRVGTAAFSPSVSLPPSLVAR